MDAKETFALVNSCLNALSTVLLIAAYVQIRKHHYRAHGTLIVAALVVSAVFLVGYLYSNFTYGSRTTEQIGVLPEWVKVSYLIFLAVHVILAMVMLPFIGMAVYRAARRQWVKHTFWSRPAYWMWLYVSVTGVMIYFLLYQILPAMAVG
jgi:uncharacterized membrane protein YozB (DUF420 family)